MARATPPSNDAGPLTLKAIREAYTTSTETHPDAGGSTEKCAGSTRSLLRFYRQKTHNYLSPMRLLMSPVASLKSDSALHRSVCMRNLTKGEAAYLRSR